MSVLVTDWQEASHSTTLARLAAAVKPADEDQPACAGAVLCARDLTTGYRSGRHTRVVHRKLNLTLERGKLTALLGPNGAGKSTLLRTLAGLQPPLEGEVWIEGKTLRSFSAMELARKLAVVLTERVEVGYMTAYALAALGRYPYTPWDGRLSAEDEVIVQEAMRAARCESLASRMVGELSDGERQRVMIARALAQQTPIIFLDEPTAFLDLPRRVEIMHLLRDLAHQTGRALLVSTHDLELALRLADTLWLVGNGGMFTGGAPAALLRRGEVLRVFATEGEAVQRYLRDLHRRWQETL